jgi:hypothetical protein
VKGRLTHRVRLLVLLAILIVPAWAAAPAGASDFDEFGIKTVSAEASTNAAGAHPDFTTKLVLNHHFRNGMPSAAARVQDVTVDLPPGLVGDPTAIPTCSMGEFNAMGDCPVQTQVGVVRVLVSDLSTSSDEELTEPIYNLEPPHERGQVARFGFFGVFFPIVIDVSVRTAGDYGVTATVANSTGLAPLLSATTTFWGVPADPSHNKQRLTTLEAINCLDGTACKAPGGERSSGLPLRPFMTNPTACQDQEVRFKTSSYQLPGQIFQAAAPLTPTTGCEQVPFPATLEVEPTNPVAGAPTGLRTTLHIAHDEDVDTPTPSAMRAAKVVLPEGMAISPGAANGIQACSDAQVGLGQEVPAACPDASKLGEASIASPSLPDAIHGAVYLRAPEPGHQFRLWLVADDFGMHVKLPGEIRANPQTGQLTAEFRETPQVPVEEIGLEIWGGDRAPLKNPATCGTYAASYELTPWSGNPAATGQSPMTIDQGCGNDVFNPRLEAGVTNAIAGAHSPFVLSLFNQEGTDNVAAMEVAFPKGLLAKLAGVPLCPDAAAATGACPGDTRIGSVTASVGPGPLPLSIPQPGKEPTGVYLAGPYKGAPFSIVTKVPAQAGPFDLGTVAIRSALHVDPETGQASVKTDPLPQFLEGAALLYRTVHVVVDRPDFVLNPTSCEEKAFRSTFTSARGATANPGYLFQVGGCKALRFSPRLSLTLRGGTERADYPALTAVLKAKKGQANIRRISVALPRSEFLAQEHIETICTRVRFAADNCPKRSIYGYAKAWTPLLDEPLSGPVYLRSSNNTLPDLVAALDGQLDIDLVGRIDSHIGGIRTTFSSVPDAPVTKFVLKMKGDEKGLLSNTVDICRSKRKAAVEMDSQNGRFHDFRAPLRAKCG